MSEFIIKMEQIKKDLADMSGQGIGQKFVHSAHRMAHVRRLVGELITNLIEEYERLNNRITELEQNLR